MQRTIELNLQTVHFDYTDRFGTWSGDGCKEVVRGNNRRVCECTQLAHFGILFVCYNE